MALTTNLSIEKLVEGLVFKLLEKKKFVFNDVLIARNSREYVIFLLIKLRSRELEK